MKKSSLPCSVCFADSKTLSQSPYILKTSNIILQPLLASHSLFWHLTALIGTLTGYGVNNNTTLYSHGHSQGLYKHSHGILTIPTAVTLRLSTRTITVCTSPLKTSTIFISGPLLVHSRLLQALSHGLYTLPRPLQHSRGLCGTLTIPYGL
jgi:hypothetical protein